MQQNSDVANVGELLTPPEGSCVSSVFPFVLFGAAQTPVSIQLLYVLFSAADFQLSDPESSHKPLLLKTVNGH